MALQLLDAFSVIWSSTGSMKQGALKLFLIKVIAAASGSDADRSIEEGKWIALTYSTSLP